MGKAKLKEPTIPNEHWIEHSHGKLLADRALDSLAEMNMQRWCAEFGGPPADAYERLALKCSLEPMATKELDWLMKMPDANRRALAHKLWPASRHLSAAEPVVS